MSAAEKTFGNGVPHEKPSAHSCASSAHLELDRNFEMLQKIADSDDDAAEYAARAIIHVLTNAANWLEIQMFNVGRSAALQKLAKDLVRWPVLHYAHPERRKRVEEKMATLKLGSGLGVQFEGKTFSEFTLANIFVEKLRSFLEKHRGRDNSRTTFHILEGRKLSAEEKEKLRVWVCANVTKLPRLSRDSGALKQWKKAGAELIPFMFGAEFQTHRELSRLGVKNGKVPTKAHFPKSGTRRERTKAQKIPDRAAWRKLIKDRIEEAWDYVASVGGE